MNDLDYILDKKADDYLCNTRGDMLDRLLPFSNWSEARYLQGVEPYFISSDGPILAEYKGHDRYGQSVEGVNLACQDYLALANHPRIKQAAVEAVDRFGVHSAGCAGFMGNSSASLDLEKRLAGFIGMRDCSVFPSGYAARHELIRTLVRQQDHVLIDRDTQASLMTSARSATLNVHPFSHLSVTELEQRLKRIRAARPGAGLLVITEALFSMDSDSPDLAAYARLARMHEARLLVSVSHDLGCMGPNGRGTLEVQGMLGKVDVVVGSFSKTFASNGGFVATNHPALRSALRYTSLQSGSNAISPVQSSVVLKALEVVDSAEGDELRSRLLENSRRLRGGLHRAGFEVMGVVSPIVPILLGDSRRSRLIAGHAMSSGGLVQLVEFPSWTGEACRLRLQLMASHTSEQIARFTGILSAAANKAETHLKMLADQRPQEYEMTTAHAAVAGAI
jgi:glycine C-acetyltransferase